MYIHMFAFRFKAGVTEEQKERVVTEIGKLTERDSASAGMRGWGGMIRRAGRVMSWAE